MGWLRLALSGVVMEYGWLVGLVLIIVTLIVVFGTFILEYSE